MNLFTQTSPAYKSVAQVSQVSAMYPVQPASNWLSGLFGSLFGSTTPPYKTVDGTGAYAPAPSGFWSVFGASSPPYKTAPAVSAAPVDDTDESIVDEGDACDPGPDTIVVL